MISSNALFYYAPILILLSTLRIDMEPVNLGYSTKNIPIAQPKEYLKCLIEKTESFLRRVRWKAYHFMNPTNTSAQQTFGFSTTNSPPPIKELCAFEDKMLKLIQNIEFKKHDSDFQATLARDTEKIKSDGNLLVAADKTTNFYRTDANTYNQLLDTAITKTYKKAPTKSSSKVISEEKKIARNLNVDNRVDALAEKDAFITLKDHKPNFKNNPTCRLINPTKSEIGIISKKILERINLKVVAATRLNQWKNTNSVIKWFNEIPDKAAHSFITFDIVEFYPSISEDLLKKALEFASQYDDITEEEKVIIIQAKKSLLFNKSTAWCKKTSKDLFDVTMGSFDGAETCELVGSYLLSKLTSECQINIGLYRDDGLAALKKTPREIENTKKQICKIFSDHNLKLTVDANKKCVDYLDITLDLQAGTYKPFMKPGNTLQYVNRHSNHPPSVLRSVPESINKRLSNISSDKRSFDMAIPPYQEALTKSGYDYKLEYKPQPPRSKRQRKRNITWFNPPFNANVATNVGSKFLAIVTECFPRSHPLYTLFNRNTLKLSYSCMPNMARIISSNNKCLLKKATNNAPPPTPGCNCQKKEKCPLPGKCQIQSVVYQAAVIREDNKEEQTYIGLTEGEFKTRYYDHTSSFRNPNHKSKTELSKYIWKLKDANVEYSIKWKILKKCTPYSRSTKRCNLCLHEKFMIICHPKLGSLNTRNELISACRHRKKHLLSDYKLNT